MVGESMALEATFSAMAKTPHIKTVISVNKIPFA
jgi:hypothetical protein